MPLFLFEKVPTRAEVVKLEIGFSSEEVDRRSETKRRQVERRHRHEEETVQKFRKSRNSKIESQSRHFRSDGASTCILSSP